MRGPNRESLMAARPVPPGGVLTAPWQLYLLLLALLLGAAACGDGNWAPVPGSDGALKSAATVRAERRLYDGAPPVIPHMDFGAACSACHDAQGISVEGVGFAPMSPHDETGDAGTTQRCRQCHVFVNDGGLFVENDFVGLQQDLRPGSRLYAGAPPTIPHRLLMRENCVACHAGPGAREEVRTSHPERTRCRQCHVPVTTRETFTGGLDAHGEGPEES